MIDAAAQIENIIVQTIREKVPGVHVQSNPAALEADDYELKTADGFILVSFMLAPKFEYGRQYIDAALQFWIAFGYKNLDTPDGLKERMNATYYAIRGIQVPPMRQPLLPVAIRPLAKNSQDIWRGDFIMQTWVKDTDKQANA